MSQPVAFLGLGVMGGPMAGHLARKAGSLRVWNRTRAKADAWAQAHQGQVCDSLEEGVEQARFVATCVGDDPDALDVGKRAIAAMQPGSCYMDHTTTSAHVSQELAELAYARGIRWVDAPVSGGQAGAINGTLTAMCGGTAEDFEHADAILQHYCATRVLIGEAGSGQRAKMVNQIAIAGVVQGLAEAVAFAVAAGLDTDAVLAAISKGAAGSWQMDNRWKTMVKGEFDFGFAVDWMRKDLRIVLVEAEANQLNLPLTALVDSFYARIQGEGGGRLDTSSLERLTVPRHVVEDAAANGAGSADARKGGRGS